MREGRGWTQSKLATKCGKRQSVISKLEDINYGRHTLSTLKALAAAFDVGLMVRFVPFSDLAIKAANLQDKDLAIPAFDDDVGFSAKTFDATNQSLMERFFEGIAAEQKPLIIEDQDYYANQKQVTRGDTAQR